MAAQHAILVAVLGLCSVLQCADAQFRCFPNPCRNGALCQDRGRDASCDRGCDRRRFGGRDCEPIENDVGPWSPWTPCNNFGRQTRERQCLKPEYFYQGGRFMCRTDTNEARFCGPRRPAPPVQPLPTTGSKCPANQVFDMCGKACPDTCDAPGFCTRQCYSGCRCRTGFVKNNDKCIPKAECPAAPPPRDERPTREFGCFPNPCRNGAVCRDRGRDHSCDQGCDRRRFGGRDCEPIDNDATPWSEWSACSGFGRQIRTRRCLKREYFYLRGMFHCRARLSETRYCPTTASPPPSQQRGPPGNVQPPVEQPVETDPPTEQPIETTEEPTVPVKDEPPTPEFGCRPGRCKNGARCRQRSLDHVCDGCNRRLFRGRDCEPIDCDATEWGPWSQCRNGRQVRTRRCRKRVYFYTGGNYGCRAPLSESRTCVSSLLPGPPAPTIVLLTVEPNEPPTTARVVINPCLIDRCQNGARCEIDLSRPAGFRCVGCYSTRFSGDLCDIPVPPKVTSTEPGPWSDWGPCRFGCPGYRFRQRDCYQNEYIHTGGYFRCMVQTMQIERCPFSRFCPRG